MLRSNRWTWTRAALALVLAGTLAACDDDDDPVTPDPLAAPSSVQATAGAGGVTVTWGAVSAATSYSVERDIAGDAGSFTPVAQNLTATAYTDATATVAGATYLYRVVAVRGTETATSTQLAEVTIPAAPIREARLGAIGTGTRTLSADTTYVISGLVTVDSGGVLRIPAGTRLVGDTVARPSALIVRVGGRIEADGTAEEPIVFTSQRPEGQRRRADWGGIVINGRSHCNFPAPCTGEAASGQYGGDRLDDSSGFMRYVRIEYAGYEVSPNNELNGLTLNGVGRGTELHHIQSHMGSDDGIEWFGGTVDLKYALVTGASDDSFDYSSGWQGRGQFWIVQQDPAEGDRAFEVDGNENVFTAEPFTDPTIYNVTLVGRGGQGSANASPAALQLRRGTKGTLRNFIVLGFNNGLDIDDQATLDGCQDGSLTMASSIFHANAAFLDGDGDAFEQRCADAEGWGDLRESDPLLEAPFDRAAPDFRPGAGSPARTGAATPPDDGFFDAVDFLGGVAPTGTPWYEGWITTATS